jgi:hypothetical protein
MFETALLAYILHMQPATSSYIHHKFNTPRTVAVGSLTVSANQIGTQSIPRGATRVEMLRVHLEASCAADVPIHSLTLQRRGLGFNTDISGIYAVSGGRRLTRSYPISRKDGLIDLRFRNFEIRACDNETITILADFSSSASIAGEHRIEIESFRDIDAGGAHVEFSTSFSDPVRRTASRSIGTVTVEKLNLSRNVKYGANRMIGRFLLRADRTDNHRINAITFTNDGTASGEDLQNVYLETSGGAHLTLTTERFYGDQVRLQFNPPLLIKKNQRRRVNVRADVRGGASRSIKLVVEELGDVESEVVRGR